MAGNQRHPKQITAIHKDYVSYVNKEDILNPSSSRLITAGSLNVLLKVRKNGSNFVSEIWKRKGYEKITSTVNCSSIAKKFGFNNLRGEYRWDTRSNQSIYVRHYGNNMIVSDNLTDWVQLNITDETLSNYEWNYTSWWDDKIKKHVLIYVNGEEENTVYRWDGNLARISGVNGNEVSLSNNEIPDDLKGGFVWICGDRVEYSKVENGVMTLVNTPNYNIGSLVASDPIKSDLINHTKYLGIEFKPTTLVTYKNHIFYADKNQNVIFVSKSLESNDYLNLEWSNPPFRRDGQTFICDNLVVGMYNVKDGVLVGCKNNEWHYFSQKTFNYGNTNLTNSLNASGEDIYVYWVQTKLTSGDQQGLKHQWLGRINQSNLTFISEEPTLNYVDWGAEILNGSENSFDSTSMSDSSNYGKLGRQNIVNLSDDIVNEFNYIQLNSANRNNDDNNLWKFGREIYFKNELYLALPEMARTYIYNSQFGFWQPPQTLPFGAYTIKDGVLYGYDYNTTDVYRVFSGYNDKGSQIVSQIVTFYDDYGLPFAKKHEDKFFFSGRGNEGTEWKVKMYYDFGENGEQTELFISARPQEKWGVVEGGQSKPRTDYDLLQFDIHTDQMDENKYLSSVHANMSIDNIGKSFYKRQILISESGKDTYWCIFSFGTSATESGESDVSSEVFGEKVGFNNSSDVFIDPAEC